MNRATAHKNKENIMNREEEIIAAMAELQAELEQIQQAKAMIAQSDSAGEANWANQQSQVADYSDLLNTKRVEATDDRPGLSTALVDILSGFIGNQPISTQDYNF